MNSESKAMDLARQSLVTPGDHIVRIVDVNESESAGPSGYGYWKMSLEVVGKDDPDLRERIPLYLSKSKEARWKVDEFLDAIRAPSTGTADPVSFIGKVMGCVIEHEKDKKGRMRASIKVLLPISEGVAKNAAPDEWDGSSIGSETLPKEAQTESSEDWTDEIPF